jgi:glycosyltransferase involved in cell wall biosynthesis
VGESARALRNIFVTIDYAPVGGGMSRRYVELCRRFGNMQVSTVRAEDRGAFDASESYRIHRQKVSYDHSIRFANQLRWGRWLTSYCRNNIDVIHCGNIRPTGYAVTIPHKRLGVPYLLYVNGGDLLRELGKSAKIVKRIGARQILGNAAGIVSISEWVSELAGQVLERVGVKSVPPIATIHLGTDSAKFHPARDTGALRARLNLGDAPVLITVARLVPHKGQDFVIRALAALRDEYPDLRYLMVGDGHYESVLRELARELGVSDRVIFAGLLSDNELPEAYATSTVYVGLSRIDREINAEGFGIAFVEAAASGVPAIAGDSGGVRSAVRDNETGIVVNPTNVEGITAAIRSLLRNADKRAAMGRAGRAAVESHYNWDRVARETREFTYNVIGERRPA